MIEGSLEVQTSDNMDRWKAEMERVREKRKSQKKEDADARKGRKVAKHCVFSMICGFRGSKSRLAKAAGAEPSGQTRDEKLHALVARSTFPSQNVQNTIVGPLLEVEMSEKCMPLWREAHFQVKMHKTHHCRTTFGSCDVENVHAVVARSTFPSQNVQSTPCSDHFWKLRCRKSARRCGAKHISKSKCTKHHMFAPLLEVQMLKKCTPLWREAHFEANMLKAPGVRTTFGSWDVEKVHAVGVKHITKGSVSYLSSPCFSTSLGGIGGPARAIHGILAVMYWISIIRGGPPPRKWSWVQFPRVTRSRAPTLEAHFPWGRCPCSPA